MICSLLTYYGPCHWSVLLATIQNGTATYSLCHIQALLSVVVKSVFSLLQHCILLHDTCANNSINSDKRNRPHSYSVQQQSPVSYQWACELVQQEQKIPHPSTKCHYMTLWWMCGVLWVQQRLLGQCLISWDYTFTPMLYTFVTFFITCLMRTRVFFCNSTLNRNGGSPFNFCY
jgi:hypothetical protein